MAAWSVTPLNKHTHTHTLRDWLADSSLPTKVNQETFKHSSDGALQTTKHVKHVEGEGSGGQHSRAQRPPVSEDAHST